MATRTPKILPAAIQIRTDRASARHEWKKGTVEGSVEGQPVDGDKRKVFVPLLNKRLKKFEQAAAQLATLSASRYDHTIADADKIRARLERATASVMAMITGGRATVSDEDLTE